MIRAAIANPHVVLVFVLAILALGALSYSRIPADLLPIFKTPAVQIVTFYPGMPPEVMERDIMSRLERWTGQSMGIEHQEGKAMLGVCIVKDFFQEGISLDTAMSQVTSYAMSDLFYLPPGTIPPMVMPFDPTAGIPLCLVSISNPEMSEKELYDIAYFELRNRLQSIQGVIAPAVYGGKLRRILCYVDRDKLEARGLSLMDVQRALREQSVLIPAGDAKIGVKDYQIFTNAIPVDVELMNDIPIGVHGGAPVLIRDVGEVRDSAQIQTNIVRTNGSRQVYIPVYRQPGANTIAIVDAIKDRLGQMLARLKEMNAENPRMQGLVMSVVMDQSVGVRESLQGLQIATLLGAMLAGLVVLLFLRSLRSTFIVMISIPLAILAAFLGLFYSGDTINAMTLGGLALAVGIVVDQSIVVIENIIRHVRAGKGSFQAATDGTREVALPILVSTITFVVVFYPVVFLSGLARFLFTPLAVAAGIAILASYLLAVTLVPACCARLLAREGARPASPDEAAPRANLLTRAYGRLLEKALAYRRIVLVLALLPCAGSFAVAFGLGTELFPPVDPGQFTVYARLPSGTRIEKTEETIAAVEQVLIKNLGEPDPTYALGDQRKPESNLQTLISNIGVLMDWPAAYTPNTGPMDAFVLVQLKGKTGWPGTFALVSRLRDELSRRFPSVEFAFDTGGMLTAALNMGEPSPIHFQITGSNLHAAQEIARLVAHEAAQVEGAVDVRIAQRMDYPTLHVEMDRVLAAYQGVTAEDVMKNLVSATNSSINFEPAFWIDESNGNHYFMGVQYREEAIDSFDTLRDVPVTGHGSERPVPIRNVSSMKSSTGPAVINHMNITRATDVYVNVLPGHDVGSVTAAIERRLVQNPALGLVSRATERGTVHEIAGPDYQGRGYVLEVQGEVRIMRESFVQFLGGLLIAGLLVYLVMVAHFRSFLDPLIVLVTVPLGFVGVAAMLALTGTSLSVMSAMGLIMMVGIVVEYSIILVDFANRRMAEGATAPDAALDAAKVRLRPILMTSATTWLALLPMAIGIAGGDANIPLARTIIGGVVGATLVTLIVVPCLYTLVKRPALRPGHST
ncbi:MAG: efflux RND transporter permease subunit [Planctomycetota bacterium]